MSDKDKLYTRKSTEPGSFRFDESVVSVFPDMINRSVPGYSLIVPMIGQLARRYVQPGSTVHDLGCSLGATTLSMQNALQGRSDLAGARIIATDNAPAMVERFQARLAARQDSSPENAVPIDLVCGDILDADFSNASLVVLNFTLQFLDVEKRDWLLSEIARGMRPGGALVLAEKIRFKDAGEQERQTIWHHDFKRLQGYSELEIARKRTALESVLLSETHQDHVERLQKAGFKQITRWFQCFAFCAYLAEK